MGALKSKEYITVEPNGPITTTTKVVNTNKPSKRIAQNYLLIWVDASIDQSNKDYQNTLTQLKSVVNDVNTFTDPNQCIQFLKDIDDEKAFVITSGSLGQHIVPDIHKMSQLDAIYIFCHDKSLHEQWAKDWVKIQGVHTSITPICEALSMTVKQCDQDFIPVSFVMVNKGAFNKDLNQLEPAFMYTQIFKDILLEMEYEQQAIKDLANYCRKLYEDNTRELKIINEFEREYKPELAIWWYTRECFTYQMLNRALRTLEGNTIINMGFFIRHLHQQIEKLYQKQVNDYKGESFTVYRGQGLSTKDFEKLCKTKSGLMSFNNFLSTSTRRKVSLKFAKGALGKTDMVGVLFRMTINPSLSSAPFAAIQKFSYFKTEEEILFSMHTVFRIGEIIQIDYNNPLYQVDLKLTSDDDQQLRTLTKHIQEEASGTGWQRIGNLLLNIQQLDKAEELYKLLLEHTTDKSEKALYYSNLGLVKNNQGNYEEAILYYEKSLEINQKFFSENHFHLAASYNNIASVYKNIGEYSKALSFYEKNLEICQKSPSANRPSLATAYNNIGGVYNNMGEYSKALSFYEKTREILERTLPGNHPSLATSYNNIGGVFYKMEQYSKALSFYEKALQIRQKTLPENHPDLATSYNNIGSVYYIMKEYPKALSFYEIDLQICQKSLPANHPSLATSYNNIGSVYDNMEEYSKALSFYEKALEIRQKTFSANHPDLATSYHHMGLLYYKMEEYLKAFLNLKHALDIWQRSLPTSHPNIKTVRDSIEIVKNKL